MRRLGQIYPAAFVTGASSGLGRAFAEMLLAEEVRVWGTSRDLGRLEPLAGPRPGEFHPVRLDLAHADGAEAAWNEAARQAGGAFDLVINNAGYGVFGEFADLPAAVWDGQIAAALGGTVRLAHAAYRAMRGRDRGCLVNVSSLAAEFPLPFMSGYNVVKSGLSALSESLIFESRGTGVAVIDLRPGDFRTAFNRAMLRPDVSGPRPDPRLAAAWRKLERHLQSSPAPAAAAADLRRALLRGRRGVVRTGSFFQARLAPLLARLAPASWVRGVTAAYFGGR
jgi:short-subunit dehydrogenase